MKRHSQLAMIRTVMNATRRQMAEYLGISESLYEKAEVNQKSLPVAALEKLQYLSRGFESTVKIYGVPQGMIGCKFATMQNFRRDLNGRMRTIRKDIARHSHILRFLTENWEFGLQQLRFLQDLKATLPAGDNSHEVLEKNIARLGAALVPYSPDRQEYTRRFIGSLEEQERCLAGILNYKF